MTTEDLYFEQMKSQINTLKAKLDQQTIITDKMIYRSIKAKTAWIKKLLVIELCIVPLILLCMLPFTISHEFSWYFFAYTSLTLICSVYADFRINRFKDTELYDKNLITSAKVSMLKMKHQRKIQLWIECPAVVFWFIWYYWERHNLSFENLTEYDTTIPFIITIILTLIVAFFITRHLFRRIQKTNDEIIEQLDELNPDK